MLSNKTRKTTEKARYKWRLTKMRIRLLEPHGILDNLHPRRELVVLQACLQAAMWDPDVRGGLESGQDAFISDYTGSEVDEGIPVLGLTAEGETAALFVVAHKVDAARVSGVAYVEVVEGIRPDVFVSGYKQVIGLYELEACPGGGLAVRLDLAPFVTLPKAANAGMAALIQLAQVILVRNDELSLEIMARHARRHVVTVDVRSPE
jgi:hypothetical protein